MNNEKLWDRDEALSRLLKNEDLLNSICSIFSKNVTERFKELCDAIETRDQKLMRYKAHSLKGMCGEVSAHSCRELFAEVEKKANRSDFECSEQIALLRMLLPKLIVQLQNS